MKCSRCQGQGSETYDEDGRRVTDVCYHCAGSGSVDEETDFHDRLFLVAGTLAYQAEKEYQHACNTDPDGDGYSLGAAENMMSEHDYFRTRVWDRQYDIAAKLADMPVASQQLMVAWNEQPICLIDELLKASPEVQDACIMMVQATTTEDEIPF